MSEFLGSASVLITPDTTKFRAALVAELAAATKGITVPVPVLAVAKGATGGIRAAAAETRGLEVASVAATSAVVGEAAALQTAGAAAAKEAVANRASAVAAAESAKAHEQLARGAGASLLTMLGLRGATLAASAPFLAGTAAVVTFAKSVREASSEQEALARVQEILGPELAKTSEEWAKQQTAMGLSTVEALKAQGAIAEVFHNVHLARPEIAGLSQELVEAAANIAAFNNVPIENVLRGIQLGISGNLRSLRQFGVIVRQADVATEALHETGKATTDELTRQDLVLARINLILRDTANQSDAVSKRQGDAAQSARELKANLANLGDSIGQKLLPPLNHAIEGLNKLIKGSQQKPGESFFGELTRQAKGLNNFMNHIAQRVLFGPAFHKDAKDAASETDQVAQSLGHFSSAFDLLVGNVRGVDAAMLSYVGASHAAQAASESLTAAQTIEAQAFLNTQAAIAGAFGQINALQSRLSNLRFQGASDAQQLKLLNQEVEQSRKAMGLARPGSKAFKQAQQDRDAAKAQIDTIIAQQKADAASADAKAKAAASDRQSAAEQAARDAQDALDKADQAFLDALGLRRGALDIRLTRAQATKGLQDDVRAQKAISDLLKSSIAAARQRIHDVLTRKQTVQELTAALVQSNQAERQLEDQEREAAAAQRKLLQDRAGQRLDLRIQIAQITGDRNAEIALHQAKIARDRILLQSVHGDLVRAFQLKLEIAQEQKAIKDLKKQVDDRNAAARSLEFSFLQEQQGFAATLLSNLLPVGAIRGTVGGAGGQSPPALGPATALASAGAVAGAGGGATRGQAGAQLDVLRAIYGLLVGIAGGTRHPEAANQRLAASANMSYAV